MLDSSRVFGCLPPEERRYLATRLHPMVLPPGQELFHQGQEAGSVLLLQQGVPSTVPSTVVLCVCATMHRTVL